MYLLMLHKDTLEVRVQKNKYAHVRRISFFHLNDKIFLTRRACAGSGNKYVQSVHTRTYDVFFT